ncbi:hypothetical protein [Devosia sp. A449]
MIPASYLFKSIYHQHWIETDTAPVVTERNQPYIDGLTSPLTAAITAILGRPHKAHRHR